jgi:hypothetical protein
MLGHEMCQLLSSLYFEIEGSLAGSLTCSCWRPTLTTMPREAYVTICRLLDATTSFRCLAI